MEIRVGLEIAYTAVQPTPMVIMLSIHPSRLCGHRRHPKHAVAEPNVPIGFYRDRFWQMSCGRLVAPSAA